MSALVTTDTIASTYEYLRTLPPFNRRSWRLPHVDEIELKVLTKGSDFGIYSAYPHRISINPGRHGHLNNLLATVAHEQIHLLIALKGEDNEDAHGPRFQKYAKVVCHCLGFDPKAF